MSATKKTTKTSPGKKSPRKPAAKPSPYAQTPKDWVHAPTSEGDSSSVLIRRYTCTPAQWKKDAAALLKAASAPGASGTYDVAWARLISATEYYVEIWREKQEAFNPEDWAD